MEEPRTETDLPIGKEEQASPPAPEPPANEQEPETEDVEQKVDEPSAPVADTSSHTSPSTTKAQTVFRDTQQLFQRLSVQARDAAVVAGQKLDQAALSLGAAVDNYAVQVCQSLAMTPFPNLQSVRSMVGRLYVECSINI